MIKTTLAMGTVLVAAAFAAGCYVGWKTTMHVFERVMTSATKNNKVTA